MRDVGSTMHVVYASDDKFSEIMGISILSLLENNKDIEDISVYILDSAISESNKDKIESIFQKYNRKNPIWIKAVNISDKLKMNIEVDRGSLSQYARLFVSSVLPENLDRVLYLDCDIIINSSLKELWNTDLKGKTIGALMDAFSRKYRPNIGLKDKDIMFNSGVMLIDLVKWKEQKIEDKLLKFISDKKGIIQQGDQGALNAVLSYDTYCFEPKYNSETVFYDFNYREMMIYRDPPEFYSEEEINDAINNPVIIHFTTSFLSERPWVEGCKHRYVDKWLLYKQMSPWDEEPLWKPKKVVGIKKMYLLFISKMPRRFVVWFSGLLHRYGKPFVFKIRNR
ncbi:MAG: glycosyltransferase family 8 protein [Oscillospiraceae bacterium]|nr:glycosyltransferase family 8 protein [Oscillospiraceae bacterium]